MSPRFDDAWSHARQIAEEAISDGFDLVLLRDLLGRASIIVEDNKTGPYPAEVRKRIGDALTRRCAPFVSPEPVLLVSELFSPAALIGGPDLLEIMPRDEAAGTGRLGQRQDCEQSLSEAEAHFEQIGTADAAADLFSPTQHGRLAGSCYLFLNDAKRAEPILAGTAHALRDRSKSQAIVLGNLALARIRQQKLDEAAASLHSAIDVVEMTWGGGGLNIVFRAGRELRPWREVPVVQDVYDRLLTLMAAA